MYSEKKNEAGMVVSRSIQKKKKKKKSVSFVFLRVGSIQSPALATKVDLAPP